MKECTSVVTVDSYVACILLTVFHLLILLYNHFCIVPEGRPRYFNVTAINYTTVFISWDRPIPTEENGIIKMYTITYNGSREEKQPVSLYAH